MFVVKLALGALIGVGLMFWVVIAAIKDDEAEREERINRAAGRYRNVPRR